MRFVVMFLSAYLIVMPSWNATAQDNRSAMYDKCMDYKQDASFCKCAIGRPYNELSSPQQNSSSQTYALQNLERRYQESYDLEISKGGLTPMQIEQVCDVVDEYYAFLDGIGVDYKTSGGKKKKTNGLRNLSSDNSVLLTLKRTELNKKIQDLNHEFQRGGALGGFSNLNNGTCRLGLEIEWEKEALARNGQQVGTVDIRALMAKSQQMCGGS